MKFNVSLCSSIALSTAAAARLVSRHIIDRYIMDWRLKGYASGQVRELRVMLGVLGVLKRRNASSNIMMIMTVMYRPIHHSCIDVVINHAHCLRRRTPSIVAFNGRWRPNRTPDIRSEVVVHFWKGLQSLEVNSNHGTECLQNGLKLRYNKVCLCVAVYVQWERTKCCCGETISTAIAISWKILQWKLN